MSRTTSRGRLTRRTVGAGLSTLFLAAGLAGLSSPAAVAAAEVEAASPGLIAAMQTDLGLTKDQALTRLAQEAEAVELAPFAERAAGDAFGGSWFDPASGELVVAVTDGGAVPMVEGTGATTELVTHSAAELDTVKAGIDDMADRAPTGVAGWGVDVRANRVVVHVVEENADDPAVREFVTEAAGGGPVDVELLGDPIVTHAAGIVGGDPFYVGNARCSIGFSVHGGFVTAGHCGTTGSAVRGWDNTHIGHVRGRVWPGSDMAWVDVGSGWWTVPVVLGWGTVPDQLVRGSSPAPVGSSICRSGSTTGWRCGTLTAVNQTVQYSSGEVAHGMSFTSACSAPGDSGGSVIAGDQAQGVHSGGSGSCGGSSMTVFNPINPILQHYGLTLHTA
ncbi:S1 family peptidase [Streptomyces calidiresistens]|uniref:S1 family peptidase n=1 Tax=Streptomyces calidiresistens TaxID=1485586 RepID=A0A7W3XXJ3_9ACTN|nr:S1 family peptidase [Streptomyces calidiresistens]MBB0230948.1 S1 family peptidase [Streptomyces calidiresistens]